MRDGSCCFTDFFAQFLGPSMSFSRSQVLKRCPLWPWRNPTCTLGIEWTFFRKKKFTYPANNALLINFRLSPDAEIMSISSD